MENFGLVQKKLEAFIRKYYLNQILKGSLFFLGIGLLYFLLLVTLEYFLWFSMQGRSILFWLFIIVEVALLFKYIGIPLLKLLKISNGIDEFQASEIIGNHFPEVNDKLKNLLQLNKNSQKSDLLLASIEQRSTELNPILFTNAVDLKKNTKQLRFVLLPLLIVIGLFAAGRADIITNSFSRISDYNKVYLKPAPFKFIINNSDLVAREGESFQLQIKTIGEYNPETVSLIIDGNESFMKQTAPGIFEYNFNNLHQNTDFHFQSNEVRSEDFLLKVIKVPSLLNLEMQLNYPDYTGFKDEILSGTGNITVPEGTRINWNFDTRNTKVVTIKLPDSLLELETVENKVSYEKLVKSNLAYSVSASNELISEYDKLDYTVRVIKDKYPEITVKSRVDSLNTGIQYFKGKVSDDYGLSQLQLVYSSEENRKEPEILNIPVSKESYDEFHFSFPGNLELKNGRNYTYYFRIFDNDAVNGAKSTNSEIYSFTKKTLKELEEEKFQEQDKAIKNIGESLDRFEETENELEEISRLEKEKEQLNYSERKKLEDFLERQKKQNDLMKSYSKNLQKTLDKNENKADSSMEEELSERLKNNEKKLEENEALLKELEEYSDKIQKEDLGIKLDKLSKQNKNNQRNLEQLLELTKKYYVEQKKQKLARDLGNLGEKQNEISKDTGNNNPKNQEKLNREFKEFQDEMDQLEKENEALQRSKDLGREKDDEEEIKKDQEEAVKELNNDNKSDAEEKQKDASEKMKDMSKQMKTSMAMQAGEQLEADAKTLRQILDNLIIFSFEQEALLEDFKAIQQNNPRYAERLKQQSNLRENFRHIDDSLYMLAMRNPMVNEVINEKLTNVEFDLEKSIERLSNNEIPQGTSSQQYVITGANDLANLLDKILASMQQMMANPQPGEGNGGEEFQLQDIIEKQQKLLDQMKQEGEGKPSPVDRGISERGEKESEELFEIYKEQQKLRMEMEQFLKENGGLPGENPVEKMRKIEEQLLDRGFDPETAKRMQQLQYELLKLEEAQKIQGKSEKRTSETNEIDYQNDLQNQIDRAKEYFNSTEILNRQILPLRQIYREKVKEYFGKGRD